MITLTLLPKFKLRKLHKLFFSILNKDLWICDTERVGRDFECNGLMMVNED